MLICLFTHCHTATLQLDRLATGVTPHTVMRVSGLCCMRPWS